jgi:hypothetical protein
MADRYCGNCGHELAEGDRFCPNCGRPVHETARVPTPEADIPVPPPPQQAGGTAPLPPQQAEAPQQSWTQRNARLVGCLGIIGVLLFLLLLIAAIPGGGGGGGGGGNVADKPQQEQNAAQQEQPQQQEEQPQQQGGGEQEPQQSQPTFSDGVFQVGTDIQAGTYRTREGSPGCYFARLGGFSGELNDLLANANTNAPAVVTIKPTDAGFESQACGTWTKDLSAITESKTSFGPGAYIVGTDMEPGTYRSSGGSACYYERLRNFTAGLNSIIANGNTSAPTIVTIKPTDAGFQSQGCGTWTKLE